MARAIREQWPISADQRKRVVDKLLAIVDGDKPGLSAKAAATLIAADNVNAKRESTDTTADSAEQARAQALLQSILADPAKLALLLDGPPPQVTPQLPAQQQDSSPPPEGGMDTSHRNGKPQAP